VDVGELGDPKSIENLGQVRQPDALPHDFHIVPLVEQPIARGHKRRGAYQHGGLLQELAAAG